MAEPISQTQLSQLLGHHRHAAALDSSDDDAQMGFGRDDERDGPREGQQNRLSRWLTHRRLLSDCAAIAVTIALALVTEMAFPPFERPIDAAVLADIDLRHPVKQNIVPTWTLGLTSFAAPLLINAVTNAAIAQSPSPSVFNKPSVSVAVFKRTFRFALSLAFTLLLTVTTTNVLKKSVGRFRPDFLDRCKWSIATMACTGEPDVVAEGRVSFPSGHSSFAFAGSTLLALWTVRTLNLYSRPSGFQGSLYIRRRVQQVQLDSGRDVELQNRNSIGSGGALPHSSLKQAQGLSRAGRFYVLLLAFVPMWAAAYIAVTRLQQFVHHPTDVLSGALLGTLIAVVVYTTQFW